MVIKVIPQYRALLFPCTDIGTMRENKATILNFDIPADLAEYTTKNFIISNDLGSYIFPLVENSVEIPNSATSGSNAEVQLVLNSPDGKEWSSQSYHVNFYNRIDDSGENIVDKAKSEQRETDRVELSETLSGLTGQDLKKSDWDELIDIANELPLKTEQNVLDLTNYSALTYAFEHATTPPSLLTGEYKLDKEEPDVPESAAVLIKLPYLNTRNVTNFGYETPISNSIEECSFDISSSPGVNKRYNVGMFQRGRANLRKLGLTGVEHIYSLDSMFNNSPVLEEIALYVKDGFIVPNEAYRTNFYRDAFVNCRRLKNIVGDPLDMSVTTTYDTTFKFCESLQYVRFKPKTINGNLDLSDCSRLMKGKYGANTDDPGTLLSIVNGVREYNSGMGQITIKFSIFVKDYLTSWRCELNPETGLYVASTEGVTLATVLTNNKGVIIA